MNRLLKFGDLFSSAFTFSSFGSPKFGTVAGGILSIILMIAGLIIFVFFGKDCYTRSNPYTSTQKVVPDDLSFIKVHSNNFTIAFRYEQYNGDKFEENGFSVVGYYYYKEDFQGYLDIVECNELNLIDPNFIKQFQDGTGWKCINFNMTSENETDTRLGGMWGSDIYYFYLDYIIDKSQVDKLSEYGLMASFMVPQYYFSPDNFGSPLNKRYQNIYLNLDKSMRKFLSMYFESPICFDDIGLIFEQQLNYTQISLAYTQLDTILNNDNDSKVTVSSISFYYNNQYDMFKRNYIKIQEVLANVGGLMQVLYYVCFILIMPYQDYKMNTKFVNAFFSFDENQEREISHQVSNVKLVSDKNVMKSLKSRFLSMKYLLPQIEVVSNSSNLNTQFQLQKLKPSTETPKSACQPKLTINPFELSIHDSINNNSCVINKVNFESSINQEELNTVFNFNKCQNSCSSNLKEINSKASSYPICLLKPDLDSDSVKDEVKVNNKKVTTGKFENFFNQHLKFMTQKKKASFNFSIPSDLYENMQSYHKKHSTSSRFKKIQKGFNPSFAAHLKLLICPSRIKDDAYSISNKLIIQKLDITNYLKLIHDTSKLKRILLNYYQNLSLNFQTKPNIYSEEDVMLNSCSEDLDRHKIETVYYYMSLDSSGGMSSTDYVILQDLETPLRNFILSKCPDLKFFYSKID